MAPLFQKESRSPTSDKRLLGEVVLVVEDEYYIASDAAEAISHAGAVIIGPCPSEASTIRALSEFQPSLAVVDLNLAGDGPDFTIARILLSRAVPTVFMTGYDHSVIPADLAGIHLLVKPMIYDEVVAALSGAHLKRCGG